MANGGIVTVGGDGNKLLIKGIGDVGGTGNEFFAERERLCRRCSDPFV